MLKKSKITKPTNQLSEMTEKFAIKSANHSKFRQWFEHLPNQKQTRNRKQKYRQIPTRADRFSDSPIPLLSNILNKKSRLV